MKRGYCLISIITVVLCMVIYWVVKTHNPYRGDQRKLAQTLGVRIKDYPVVSVFPVGYFYTVLEPGVSIEQVHEVIKGYERVMHCHGKTEIYYYFSEKDTNALRFEVFYDDGRNFEELRGEDENSRTIRINDCLDGLLSER